MKCIFLVNNAPFLAEFFGKVAGQMGKQGDECLVVASNKIAEYENMKFFPDKTRLISKVDWCAKNYQKGKTEFGGLAWEELFSDFSRFKALKFNYGNSLNRVSQIYQFFDHIFRDEKPDMIISEPPAGLFHGIAYYFCRRNNIPYVGLNDSLYEGRIDLFDYKFTSSKYEKTFREIKDNDISENEKEFSKDFIEKLISHTKVHSYVGLVKINFTQLGLIRHYFEKVRDIKPLLKYIFDRKYFKDFDYESESSIRNVLSSLWEMERRQFRILFQKNIFPKIKGNNDDFFIFPLHFQPEASTSVWATYYCDQLNTIKNIALTLPFPYKLYVKEHPAAVGLRTREFYKELRRSPNVVLIPPYENVEQLVRRSAGVITLTSTVGMEAALAGKPVYVLGNVFYSYHPMCKKVKSFEELKDRISGDLINKPDIGNLENINRCFIISCFRNTIKGNVVSASQDKDDNNYQLICDELRGRAFQN